MTMTAPRPTAMLPDLLARDQQGLLTAEESAYLESKEVVDTYRAMVKQIITDVSTRLRDLRTEEEAWKGILPTATDQKKREFHAWRLDMYRERSRLIELKEWADRRSRELRGAADRPLQRLKKQNATLVAYLRGLLREQLAEPESERDNVWIAELTTLIMDNADEEAET